MRGNVKGNAPAKIKDLKGTTTRLLGYLKPFKILVIIVVICAILSTMFTVFAPKVVGNVTTELFEGTMAMMNNTGSIDMDFVRNTLMWLLAIYVCAQIFNFFSNFFLSKVGQEATRKLRSDVSNKIHKLPLNYFDTNSFGDVLSRVSNDVDTISASLQQIINQFIVSLITVVGIIIMMLSMNVIVTLVCFAVLPLVALVSKLVISKSQKYFVHNSRTLGKVNGYIEENYSGHSIITGFNRQNECVKEFKKFNDELYEYSFKSQFISGIMMPLVNGVGNLAYVLIVGISSVFAIQGKISVGNIQSFIQYTRQFMQPMGQLAQVSNIFQSTLAAAERVFELLDEEEEIAETSEPKELENVQGNVSFKNVYFGYNADKPLIKDFNLEVKAGQKVAIVGPTGAGKTTLINLLMRFYDINSGSIEIDGVSIYDVKRDNLRDQLGMVLQDTWLFNGTIYENLAYGSLQATDELIYESSKSAHAHHFIKTLPDGYQMTLGEDAGNISGGQKQLLTIARAFISQPNILILDEATSAVDTLTEVMIQRAMEKLMEGKTSFVIAHRLSTIKDADVILVLNEGNIVEKGTHDELIAKHGFYENLYNSQFDSSVE